MKPPLTWARNIEHQPDWVVRVSYARASQWHDLDRPQPQLNPLTSIFNLQLALGD